MNSGYDVIIIGAGAAGLFCAFNAAQQNKRVLVLDHANKVGKKILMSGGGRCNFTNLNTSPEDFISENPHFCKSALKQYTAYDFLALVEKHKIEYVEKAPGQLFCKDSSKDVLNMLLKECAEVGVKIYKKCTIENITSTELFNIKTSQGLFSARSLVIATGGLSIPTLGASGYGYKLAEKFGHTIVKTNASLVPFTLSEKLLESLKELSGLSLKVSVTCNDYTIDDDMLFTHRGISGPAILKLSAYWNHGQEINIDLLPANNIIKLIEQQKQSHPDKLLSTFLSTLIPKRLALYLMQETFLASKLKQLNTKELQQIENIIHYWKLRPSGTEGYRTAEVTSGGISTEKISSKTFESDLQKNLYFIGEVLDVTGQLGGYNFQWAWSSAWCAAQSV